MKQILLFTFFTFSIYVNGQVDCPLNTPEFPFDNTDDASDRFAWSSGLYMPVQLGGAQTLTSISFRMDNHFSPGYAYTYNDFDIYVRHTAVDDFTSDPNYPGTAGFTKVYDGSLTLNNPGVYSFTFNVAT